MTDLMTVLVVDDEPVILGSARRVLESERTRVLTAADAESALSILAAEPVDVLISDLVLPGISGMKLLERALDHDPGLAVVITTGYSTVENAVAALRQGAFDFLPKPFTCDELLSCFARARRAVELRLTVEPRGTFSEGTREFQLGPQTWARPEKDGTALLGLAARTLQTLEPIEGIDLPEVGAELRQGGRLVVLRTSDGLSHALWSPLGGRVLALHDGIRDRPESLRGDAGMGNWLVRIQPGDLEGELPNLSES